MSVRQNETRAPELIGALSVCPAIAAIFVAMRFYTRMVLIRKHFLEDWMILAALASAIAMSVFMGLSKFQPNHPFYEQGYSLPSDSF